MFRVRDAVVALAALMLLSNCSSSATQSTSIPDTGPTGATASQTDATSLPLEDCEVDAPQQYDVFGSIHTIVVNQQPIAIEITPNRPAWCSGGRGEADIVFTNRGIGREHLDSPILLLHGGAPKWPIASLESFDLAPGERHAVHVVVSVPGAPPGRYQLAVYGFYNGYVPITIEGPGEP